MADEAAVLDYSDASYFENPAFGSPESGGYHGYKSYLVDRPEIEAKFEGVLAHVETIVSKGTLLDVGAGPGFLVSAARRRGWTASGVDMNPWAATHATEELGVPVSAGSIDDLELAEKSLDAITMMDLIEHVPDPDSLMESTRRLVREGGALAILTPDAGSPVSRALGMRWPEIQRVPEHLVLFSVAGLARLLERHGFDVVGWHPIGKRSRLKTLLADVSPVAPAVGRIAERLIAGRAIAERQIDLDPRTKFCLYARRSSGRSSAARGGRPSRLPKSAPKPEPEESVFEDLKLLAGARGFTEWIYSQYASSVRGRVAEVGAGIGTFSSLMLERGASEMVLIEPATSCAAALEQRFAREPRIEVVREFLPDSPALARGGFDLVVCQNVLEHIWFDWDAMRAMAQALVPGGRLVLLIPAHPRLFGGLDQAYGHYRRYTRAMAREAVEAAGLQVESLRHFNVLGIPGWWGKSRLGSPTIGARALAAYEIALRIHRPLEECIRPSFGLSIVLEASAA